MQWNILHGLDRLSLGSSPAVGMFASKSGNGTKLFRMDEWILWLKCRPDSRTPQPFRLHLGRTLKVLIKALSETFEGSWKIFVSKRQDIYLKIGRPTERNPHPSILAR